jgi:predicted RNA-binding Zn-ribbon protein involved in translation (DUF1610 family)
MDVEKLVRHATEDPMWKADVLNLSASQAISKFANRAVCPRCERWAYRTKGWAKEGRAVCPKCGWSGKTITIDEYLAAK